MANSNWLKGLQCPQCGSEAPLIITVEHNHYLTDDGPYEDDNDKDLIWTNTSPCQCSDCSFEATVAAFTVDSPTFGATTATPPAKPDEHTAQCASCEKVWDISALDPIHDFWSRVEPGGVIPAGDCPDEHCGAFCYPLFGYAYTLEQRIDALTKTLETLRQQTK